MLATDLHAGSARARGRHGSHDRAFVAIRVERQAPADLPHDCARPGQDDQRFADLSLSIMIAFACGVCPRGTATQGWKRRLVMEWQIDSLRFGRVKGWSGFHAGLDEAITRIVLRFIAVTAVCRQRSGTIRPPSSANWQRRIPRGAL